MGAGNVKVVYGLWGHLPDRAFRLLAFMALSAKDDDDPPKYWGGRESLAVGLGRDVPTGDTDEAAKTRHATFEAVRGALAQLVKADAITRTRSASPGRTAEYALNLKIALVQGTPAPNDAGESCALVQAQPAQRDRPGLRMAQAEPVPEEEQEDRGLTSGPRTHHQAQVQRAPSARDRHEFVADEYGLDCECGLPAANRVHRWSA